MTPWIFSGFRRMEMEIERRSPRIAMMMIFIGLCSEFGLIAVAGQALRTPGTSRHCPLIDLRPTEQCLKVNRVGLGACSDPTYCMCTANDDENFVRGRIAREYCEFLLQDTPDNWRYPFRGRHPNPDPARTPQQELNYRCSRYTYCLAFVNNPSFPGAENTGFREWFKTMFRFTPFDDQRRPIETSHEVDGRVNAAQKAFHAKLRNEITNRLQFTDETIAQEGISFCIAGRHLKRSPLSSMDSLRGFLPLIERSFDIGNHVSPTDSIQMNRFDLTQEHKGFFSKLQPRSASTFYDSIINDEIRNWNLDNDRGIHRYEYENVFMGFTRFEFRNFDWTAPDPINLNQNLEVNEGFKTRPSHLDYQPGAGCRNPYRVQVTTIEADGKALHNYLHIKVFAEDVGNPTGQRCPTGKIRLMMLEVRDELGYPVGQFTDDVPCDMDEATLTSQLKCPGNGACRRWTGTKANQVPCMITHPESTVHPWIFMVSASDSLSAGGGGGGIPSGQGQPAGGAGAATTSTQNFCRDSSKPPTPVPNVPSNDNYFTEIHATWRFAQMNNRWTKELHFATLIIEDTTPIQYYTSRKTLWQGPDTPDDLPCNHFKKPVTNHEREMWIFNPLECPLWNPNCHRESVCRDPANFAFRFINAYIQNRNPPGYVGKSWWCCRNLGNNYYNCDDKCGFRSGRPVDIDPHPDDKEDKFLPRVVFDDQEACFRWGPFQSPWSKGGVYHLALLNRCVDEKENTNRPYGYSAKYTVLKPTFKTMGGWDNLQKKFIAPEVVNCHVDLTAGDLYDFSTTDLGKFPVRASLLDYLDYEYRLQETPRYKGRNREVLGPPKYPLPQNLNPYDFPWHKDNHREFNWCIHTRFTDPTFKKVTNIFELSDWHSIGVSKSQSTADMDQMLQFTYFGRTAQSAARKMFRSAHQDPIVLKAEFPDHPLREYFGSEHVLCPKPVPSIQPGTGKTRCPEIEKNGDLQVAFDLEQSVSLQEMSERSRCPCPFIPTTAPPELQTKTDVEIDGRQLHVINTLFAWMVLIPMAFFVARFYKETFSKVFFLQEFWWYTIHVLTLLTALLFTFGGIYGMRLKRDESYVLVWTNATAVHIYTAYVLIGLFVVHLCIGPFRLYNPEWRMIQIALHWGIGWVEYSLALVVTLSATAIPSGMMNCVAFGVYCGFILFQIAMTVGMELHMRFVVDMELALDPPREYMPPPMMRVFHRDAPHSKCRMVVLIVFVVGCITFYGLMHTFIHLDGGETGCFQPKAANSSSRQ